MKLDKNNRIKKCDENMRIFEDLENNLSLDDWTLELKLDYKLYSECEFDSWAELFEYAIPLLVESHKDTNLWLKCPNHFNAMLYLLELDGENELGVCID